MINKLLLFYFVFSKSFVASAATTAPNQDIVDRWIYVAAQIDPAKLEGSGHFTCQNAIAEGPQFKAYDNDAAKAQAKYLLKCLQYQCSHLDQRIRASARDILTLSDQDLTDFMYSNGSTQEQINATLAARKNPSASLFPEVTCSNGTALDRAFAFDSCFTLPIQCSEI